MRKLKNLFKKTIIGYFYIKIKNILRVHYSQSNEEKIIAELLKTSGIPKVFIEFGFSGWEFNCIQLALDREWEGLLVDGDSWNVRIAKNTFHKNIVAKKLWIDLDSIEAVRKYAKDRKVGILSIDVDGNDYWFLEKLIDIKPVLIIVEFNVALGLLPISIPYCPNFDRRRAHKSHEYYGSSIAALEYLCRENGYSLVATSENGVNGFFLKDEYLNKDIQKLTIHDAFGPKFYPDGTAADSSLIWGQIKHMPYVDVTRSDATFYSKGTRFY